VLAASPSRYRELLEAERAVREQMWNSQAWRRMTIQDGCLENG
jgi:ATP-binding cassette subfamily B protein